MTARSIRNGFVSAVFAACLVAAGPASADLAAVFDWSMPARFAVPDPPAPGGAYEVYVAGALHPASWRVDFDACASQGAVTQYHWSIDGTPVASVGACDAFSWDFPAEGRHRVSLRVTDALGGEHTTERGVAVEDRLVFGLGDSYGSGEGAPDVPVPLELITLANAKQAALDAALAARNAAAAVYAQRLAEFNLTTSEINAVLAALGRYERAKDDFADECPSLSIACAQATAELAAAATALGVELARVELAHLDLDASGSIRSALTNLRNAAQGVLDLALDAYEAAQAAVEAAEAELAAARADLQAVWQNRRCHRSARSAQAEAARLLEASDPRSSVTFVHLSCSGATIREGILFEYGGIEDDGPAFPPQLDVLAELALVDSGDPGLGTQRPVDAILLSIGGNDVNFATVVELCVTFQSCPLAPVLDATAVAARAAWCATAGLFASHCAQHLTAGDALAGIDAESVFQTGVPGETIASGLDDLPDAYEDVATALEGWGLGATPLLLTEYPDITRDEQGDTCGWAAADDAATRQRNLIGIDTDEMTWAAEEVAAVLGVTMASEAERHGWRFVAGAAALFGTHGYCSADPWVVRLQDSFAIQGQPWGMVHPNEAGYAAWAEPIAAAVPEPETGAAAIVAGALLAGLARARRSARLD